jgi:hypothetical protein
MIHRYSLRVLAADLIGSLGNLALSAYAAWVDRQPAPEPPAEPTVPDLPRQRDVTVDDATLEAAADEAVTAILRQVAPALTPVSARAEIVALEAMWRAPSAGVER